MMVNPAGHKEELKKTMADKVRARLNKPNQPAKKAEPEMQRGPVEPEPAPEPVSGMTIALMPDDGIQTSFFGTHQNYATFFGLLQILENEVRAMASISMGGRKDKMELMVTNLGVSLGNMANVLLNLQNGIQLIGERLSFLEDLMNDEPESEQQESTGEEVSEEGSEGSE
jgi:hypothetical protein